MNLMEMYLNLYNTMSQYECAGYKVPEYRFVIDVKNETFSLQEKKEDNTDFYWENITENGTFVMVCKTVEELSELIQQISKWIIGENDGYIGLAEETADVQIMLEQFLMIMEDKYHGFGDKVAQIKEDKIKRQKERNGRRSKMPEVRERIRKMQ